MEIWTYHVGGGTYHRPFLMGLRFFARYAPYHVKDWFRTKHYVVANTRGEFFDGVQKPFSGKLIIKKRET